jgi:hypothetical protein
MRKTQPKYGWHTSTKGCDTKNCNKPKISGPNLTSASNLNKIITKESRRFTNLVNLICPNCDEAFTLTPSQHKAGLKRGQTKFYCSRKCVGLGQRKAANMPTCMACGKQFYVKVRGLPPKYCSEGCGKNNTQTKRTMITCANCSKEFMGTTRETRPSKYCSKKCANEAKVGIASRPLPRIRKGEKRICPRCDKNEIFNMETSCPKCKFEALFDNRAKDDYEKVTIADLKARYSITSFHAKVRGHARSIFKRNRRKMICSKCGYTDHVDVCHIKDVKDFAPTASIAEVNDISNLTALCRNHHWEFDNLDSEKKTKTNTSLLRNREIITIKELKASIGKRFSNIVHSDSQRTYFNSGKKAACKVCGYSKRIDVAHIKAIKEFSETALISEVNHIDNLVALCPTHHWKFDHPKK